MSAFLAFFFVCGEDRELHLSQKHQRAVYERFDLVQFGETFISSLTIEWNRTLQWVTELYFIVTDHTRSMRESSECSVLFVVLFIRGHPIPWSIETEKKESPPCRKETSSHHHHPPPAKVWCGIPCLSQPKSCGWPTLHPILGRDDYQPRPTT